MVARLKTDVGACLPLKGSSSPSKGARGIENEDGGRGGARRIRNTVSRPTGRLARLCLFGLMLFAVGRPARAMERADMEHLLAEANELFRQANETAATDPDTASDLYARAALRFERIVKEGGVENGKLYYNLGNAYFRRKDLGRAILHYRRARRYLPNDPNLHQNLEYARARRVDSIEERQKTRVLKTLFFWHYDLSATTRSAIFIGAFALFWACALMRLFLQRPWVGRSMRLFLAAALLAGGSLAAEALRDRGVRPGVMIAGETVARKGDSQAYEPSFTDPLHAGTEFLLVEARGDWYQVELMDGRTCWIPAASAELVR